MEFIPTNNVALAKSLTEWMESVRVGEPGASATVEPLAGGTQNLLFQVTKGSFRAVLRAAAPDSPSKMKSLIRELTLLPALEHSEIPHARFLAGCEDSGVIGSPFYLMEHVDGWSPEIDRWPDDISGDPVRLREIAFSIVDSAATMANFDWRSAGLEEFGHPEGFHDRQVDRWSAYFDGFKFRELPGWDAATGWLRMNRPTTWEPGLMHGDFHFHNLMYSGDNPVEVVAVLDWEMATIGDPLLDLGYMLIAWHPEGDDMRAGRNLPIDLMPSRAEILDRYSERTGRSTQDIDYYVVLARWKMAIILEGSFARYSAGEWDDPVGAILGVLSADYMRKAGSLAEHLGRGSLAVTPDE
ncbi:phosphotransferase family protein [Microbacterium sp. A93]|uniref:phosphotransferase family protein n=1 Tax=Microbacterium sp. A93 TaxID=3450716 RepID=UPI003F424D9E